MSAHQAIPVITAIVLMVLGLSYAIHARRWIQMFRHILETPERFFLGALVMVFIGSATGLLYDNWSGRWPLFITLLAWLVALEGMLFLLVPSMFKPLSRLSDRFLLNYTRGGGVLLFILGVLTARHFLA